MPNLERSDILSTVESYMRLRTPGHRYASFDYCYRYFRDTPGEQLIQEMERSCLALGFYLASWGMFRGKSSLLQRSAEHYIPIVQYVAEQPTETWDLDVCTCDSAGIDRLRDIYQDIRSRMVGAETAHLTLVTKVMLGVFGVVPAIDRYFGDAFREISPNAKFRTFGRVSLEALQDFYQANKPAIERARAESMVLSFPDTEGTKLHYTRAKILDMYGFTKGGGIGAIQKKGTIPFSRGYKGIDPF